MSSSSIWSLRWSRLAAMAILCLLLSPAAFSKTKKPATPPDTPVPKAIPVDEKQDVPVRTEHAGDGSVSYWFKAGVVLSAKDAPDIAGKTLDVRIEFDYRPEHDANAVLISQGSQRLGWAIHLVEGKPCFTINYDGLRTTMSAEEALTAGHITLRGLFGLDGSLALSATGLKDTVRGFAPMEDGFPRQPDQGLSVGGNSGSLSAKDFPNSASFEGRISQVMLHVMPATAKTAP